MAAAQRHGGGRYEQSIQTAFREVMDAGGHRHVAPAGNAQRAQAASSQAALALSERAIAAAWTTICATWTRSAGDFANQIALIEVRTERQRALASLFRALGGGWRGGNDDVVAQAATRR